LPPLGLSDIMEARKRGSGRNPRSKGKELGGDSLSPDPPEGFYSPEECLKRMNQAILYSR